MTSKTFDFEDEAVAEAARILSRHEEAERLADEERFEECDDIYDEVWRDSLSLVEGYFGPKIAAQQRLAALSPEEEAETHAGIGPYEWGDDGYFIWVDGDREHYRTRREALTAARTQKRQED